MKHIRILIVFFFFVISLEAHSKSDGISLLKGCKSADLALNGGTVIEGSYVGSTYCLGLIRGVYNSIDVFGQEPLNTCLPEKGIGTPQLIKIVIYWLENNPKELHQSDWLLIMLAIQQSYKCSSNVD